MKGGHEAWEDASLSDIDRSSPEVLARREWRLAQGVLTFDLNELSQKVCVLNYCSFVNVQGWSET